MGGSEDASCFGCGTATSMQRAKRATTERGSTTSWSTVAGGNDTEWLWLRYVGKITWNRNNEVRGEVSRAFYLSVVGRRKNSILVTRAGDSLPSSTFLPKICHPKNSRTTRDANSRTFLSRCLTDAAGQGSKMLKFPYGAAFCSLALLSCDFQ